MATKDTQIAAMRQEIHIKEAAARKAQADLETHQAISKADLENQIRKTKAVEKDLQELKSSHISEMTKMNKKLMDSNAQSAKERMELRAEISDLTAKLERTRLSGSAQTNPSRSSESNGSSGPSESVIRAEIKREFEEWRTQVTKQMKEKMTVYQQGVHKKGCSLGI